MCSCLGIDGRAGCDMGESWEAIVRDGRNATPDGEERGARSKEMAAKAPNTSGAFVCEEETAYASHSIKWTCHYSLVG
jgi:hypothetical protein